MTRAQRLLLAGLVLVTGLLVLFGGRRAAGDPLDIAIAYLSLRGRESTELDAPVDRSTPAGTLVVVLPGLQPWEPADAVGLLSWVRSGGTVVLLPDAGSPLPDELQHALGLGSAKVLTGDPGTYAEWSVRQAAVTTLAGPAGTVRVAAATWKVACPDQAEVEYRDGEGVARICSFEIGAGKVRLLADGSIFGGALLALDDNLALLEATFPEPGPRDAAPILVDAHVHGRLVDEPIAGADVLNLLAAQVALLYLFTVWQRARPLGPPRLGLLDREPGMVRELRTLGRLHAAAGHGAAAARRMLQMVQLRHPGDPLLASLPHPDAVQTVPDAIAASLQVARLQHPRP